MSGSRCNRCFKVTAHPHAELRQSKRGGKIAHLCEIGLRSLIGRRDTHKSDNGKTDFPAE